MPKFSSQMPTMDSVFKLHPRPEVLKGLLETYRLQAKVVIQESMPAGIARLQALIAGEQNPDSPLWVGQVEKGAYRSENLRLWQPHQINSTTTSAMASLAGVTITQVKDVQGILTGQRGLVDVGVNTDADTMDIGWTGVAGQEGGTNGSNEPSDSKSQEVGMNPHQRVGAHWFEVFARNPNQEECIRIVRDEAEALMFCLNDLRVWLALEIPVIEDGNSFGADVQSHMSTEIDKCFNRATGYMNGAKRHYDDRAALVKNWIQMPNVADHPASIAASDRIDHVLLRGYLRNMLVIYGGVLANLEKNWVKIINPKGQGGGGDAMY